MMHAVIDGIDAWGGSWEAIVESLHNEQWQVEAACGFIETGVPSGVPKHGANTLRASIEFVTSVDPVRWKGRCVSALLVALPTDPMRQNAYSLYALGDVRPNRRSSMGVYPFLGGGLVDSERPLRHEEFEVLGRSLGWAPTVLLDELLDCGRYRGYNGSAFRRVANVENFLHQNIDAIRFRLTPARAEHVRIWERLSVVGTPDVLRSLSTEIADAATANSKTLSKAVAPLFERLAVSDRVDALTRVLEAAKPPQRGRVVHFATQLPAGPEREAFVSKLQSDLAADRSAPVRDALVATRVAAATASSPALPRPSPPAISSVDFPPDHERASTAGHSFEWVNGRGPLGSRPVEVLATAISGDHPIVRKLTPHHVARVLFASVWWDRCTPLLSLLHGSPLRPSPLDVTSILMADGIDERRALHFCCSIASNDPDFWTDAEVTEWADHHEGELITMLDDRSGRDADRDGYLVLLGKIERRSEALQTAIIRAAVVGYQADRATLYGMLDANCIDAVVGYLSSRKRLERLGAAEMLRTIRSGVPADTVRAVARKEADELVLSALLAVLTAWGESIDEFVSVDALSSKAAKATGKKNAIPADLAWLMIDSLPQVRWADGSGSVDPAIMHWFLASAVRAKTSEPSPLTVRHFEAMNRSDLHEFGAVLLGKWIAEDEFVGSATRSKGLLAVVAASAGPEVAEPVGGYLRVYRGSRMSQAKSLLQMLAWIDEPTAVQQLMTVATRFRPKGIQSFAMGEAELLAERKGWTLDDLADRSVPDAGFEPDGRRVHDYGGRTFTAHLADDLSITLVNDETGRTVSSLPKPRSDEDDVAIAELRKDFSAAKKELKSVAAMQPIRLHQAMCVQRVFNADDFRRYFLDHPVMVRLASRLVWTGTVGDGAAIGFRPLTDGTLIGADDEELALCSEMAVRIAHAHVMSRADTDCWLSHLVDYEVNPLFPQFGRPLVPTGGGVRVVDEFVGHLIDDGSLRSQMNRYAWQMGEAMDGGHVGEVVKDVPAAELTAVLSLHGGLNAGGWGVGSIQVALGQLFFVPKRAKRRIDESAVPLSDVSPIMLSELFAEVQAIAQAGSGFDPNYKEKVAR